MGLKSFVRTRKKILLKVGIVIILLCCIWGLYSRYLAPTRVALINFPAYQASSIALANDSRMIQVDALKPEDASKLKNYDIVILGLVGVIEFVQPDSVYDSFSISSNT